MVSVYYPFICKQLTLSSLMGQWICSLKRSVQILNNLLIMILYCLQRWFQMPLLAFNVLP